ncbi:MAG: UDP-N-acetylmuramoyl-L-alanyl-D-glutamate--2,6-diaminopimelate ligase [Bacteroidota bacterium]
MLKDHALSTLLEGVVVDKLIGDPAVRVQAISFDSRTISKATLFVALRGTQADGHDYIQEAVAAGSIAVVCTHIPNEPLKSVTYVVVADTAQALGLIASNFYGRPSTQLQLVAVTGTNGKTSTVHLLYGIFRQLGYCVGMLSTIHNRLNTQILPTTLTTLDAIQINALLARMVEQRCQYCFMEASSHAIVQERIAGLQFTGAVFLNITHDHLDYHQSFDAYIKAKKKLFDDLPASAFALCNVDDKRGRVMTQNTKAQVHSFAVRTSATFTTKILTNTLQGLELYIANRSTWVQVLGTFNAYNVLAAYATARLLGADTQAVLEALSILPPIQGRFQHMHAQALGFDVIVDYAHTPDALKHVLTTITQMKSQSGRMITVLGCGGDRDKQKRPRMAQISLRLSDLVIFTSDNPRSEAPQAIIQDMKVGMTPAQQQQALTIIDREEAIKVACQLAKPHDIVLIAGKGHENYQEIQGKRYPFDDRKILQNILFQ